MLRINRRDFLKYAVMSGIALGLEGSVIARLSKALAAGGSGLANIVWLNAANCTGCTISLANRISEKKPVDLAELLLTDVNLCYHPNLMSAAGELAVEELMNVTQGDYVLAVDGGIPTAFGGRACTLWTYNDSEVTALQAVQDLSRRAQAILAIGTCASFGGVPAAKPNPTKIVTVSEATGKQTINIPGCPPHPDWIIWTIAQLLVGVIPTLDSDGRPAAFFKGERLNVHERCPRREKEEAETFGQAGLCLKELGCKGPQTQADCPTRWWNNKSNWCIGANAQCIGCTEQGFPDSFSPFYKKGESESESDD